MYRSSRTDQGEAELELLLREVDEATGRDGGADESLEIYWEAWEALPWYIRDWLLATAPGWWALSAGAFRRLLLVSAGLIIWDGRSPLAALQRAAVQLRLPPPHIDGRPLSSRVRAWRPAPAVSSPLGGLRTRPRTSSVSSYRRPASRQWYRSAARRRARPPRRGFGRSRPFSFRR